MKVYTHNVSRAIICTNDEAAILVHADLNSPTSESIKEAVRRIETDDKNIFTYNHELTKLAITLQNPPINEPEKEPSDPTNSTSTDSAADGPNGEM